MWVSPGLPIPEELRILDPSLPVERASWTSASPPLGFFGVACLVLAGSDSQTDWSGKGTSPAQPRLQDDFQPPLPC